MLQTLDIASMSNVIKQDLDDTTCKVTTFASWIQNFSEFIETLRINEGRVFETDKFNDLLEEYVVELGANDSTVGLSITVDGPLNITRDQTVVYNGDSQITFLRQVMTFKTSNATKTIAATGALASGTHDLVYELTVDNTSILDHEHFDIMNEVVGTKTLLSYVAIFEDSLAANEFLQDIILTLKNPKSYTGVINKWLLKGNLSSSLKDSINSALHQINDDPYSIMVWLQQTYDSMKTVTFEDDEFQFSSTDYVVRNAFTTVVEATLGAIAGAVGLIAFAINKVAGAIVMAIQSIGQAIISAIQRTENPLITLKPSAKMYNGFLPIPVLQETVNVSSRLAINPTDHSALSMRFNHAFADFRVFRNKGTNVGTSYEAFIKCTAEPVTLSLMLSEQLNNGSIVLNSGGFVGLDEYYHVLHNDYNCEFNCYYICDIFKEMSQALYVLCHLVLFYLSFIDDTSTSVDSGMDCYNAIKADTATPAQVNTWIASLMTLMGTNDFRDNAFKIFYEGETIHMWYAIDWNFVVNHFIPAIRNNMTMDRMVPSIIYAIAPLNDFDVAGANQAYCDHCLTATLQEDYTFYFADDCFNQSDSDFVIPKYTGGGLLAFGIASIITIAVITTAVIIATIKLRKVMRKVAFNKIGKLTELKTFAESFRDDPKASKIDKDLSFEMYDKAVRSYNRFSWLWGGGTWSSTNGWVDYASASGSSANVASDISSKLTDEAIKLSTAEDLYANEGVSSTNSIPEIIDAGDTLEENVLEIKASIQGI